MIKRKIKIEDNDILRQELIKIYYESSKDILCKYGLNIISHVLKYVNLKNTEKLVIDDSIKVINNFIMNKATIHNIREMAFQVHRLARRNSNVIETTCLRVIGHSISISHMKEHAIVASDYSIKLINIIYNDQEHIIKERQWQIKTLKNQRKTRIFTKEVGNIVKSK